MDLAIIGAGKWGQALYHAFSQKNSVVITSRRKRSIENFVPLGEALKRGYLIVVIEAQAVRGWLEGSFIDGGQKFLVASKGMETSTGAFLNGYMGDYVDWIEWHSYLGPIICKRGYGHHSQRVLKG